MFTRSCGAVAMVAALWAPARADDPEASVDQPDDVEAETSGVVDETVVVVGGSAGDLLERSSAAVQVVDTERARQQTADLGEVMARVQGLSVQRSGGAGSDVRVSMNGFSDEQIRFFLDGLPLELAGYPIGIADVPVNLIDRIEIYRGVVPVRFGADALGGAINLVSERPRRGVHGAASYQVGSFGTHRFAAGAQRWDDRSGLFTRAAGFLDRSANDYRVDVDVTDELGRLSPATVPLHHAEYRAGGANLEVGFLQRAWAERLLLRLFATGVTRELPTNAVMTTPYGDVTTGEIGTGTALTWERPYTPGASADVTVGYGFEQSRLLDVGTCVFDWYGRCVATRPMPGEIEAVPHDQRQWRHAVYARVNARWIRSPTDVVAIAIAPTYTMATGEEGRLRTPTALDPLRARKHLFTLVGGAEYEAHRLADRLENVAFVKGYLGVARATIPVFGDVVEEHDHDVIHAGVGDALRFRFRDWIWAKLSYEWATRLPGPDEVFGDGRRVRASLDLAPETSHNANLGVTIDARGTLAGAFRLDVNGFVRAADELIVLLGDDRFLGYHNVFSARSLGAELAAGWTSRGELLAIDGNLTWQDFRNTSSDGEFAFYDGDRIPNQPWLFASGSARGQLRDVVRSDDELTATFTARYVREFFRGWESAGIPAFKQMVPSQVLCSLGLGYRVRTATATLGLTVEVQNLLDRAVYDFYGVQKPGRAFYLKSTIDF
jgi:outer membrane cobalamin receptor